MAESKNSTTPDYLVNPNNPYYLHPNENPALTPCPVLSNEAEEVVAVVSSDKDFSKDFSKGTAKGKKVTVEIFVGHKTHELFLACESKKDDETLLPPPPPRPAYLLC
ncbi:hypothetical protein SESBI_02637 [Sesbania bispinosa]|nr:hypothetical protein SESBI_02637 [Sesbania bispinosa]